MRNYDLLYLFKMNYVFKMDSESALNMSSTRFFSAT